MNASQGHVWDAENEYDLHCYFQDPLQGIGVNFYTFGVALGPPPNAEFGPGNGALGPRNH